MALLFRHIAPSPCRVSVGGLCYPIINRGNARAVGSHEDGDYQVFIDLIAAACGGLAMRVLGFCLMPDHLHLLLRRKRPREAGMSLFFRVPFLRRYAGRPLRGDQASWGRRPGCT